MITSFEEVKMRASKTIRNDKGKLVARTKTFYQTLNPFNKNKDGSIKNREQIQKELLLEIKGWQAC